MIQMLFVLVLMLGMAGALILAVYIGVGLIYIVVTSFFVYVKTSRAAVVHDLVTGHRRVLHEGIHLIKCGEKLVPIDWKWNEEGGHVFHFNDNRVPTDIYTLKIEPIRIRTRYGTVLNIHGQVSCRIVDPVSASYHSQPMHSMLVQLASAALVTTYKHTYGELCANRTEIQREIYAETTNHIKNSGIICTEFIITSIVPV